MNTNLEVLKLITLSKTAKAIQFKLTQPFQFQPGQFVMLQLDLEKTKKFKVNNKSSTQKRAFSMSSSPLQKDYLEITVKTTEDPFFSDYLINYLEVGEIINVSGPHGIFYFNEKTSSKNVMLIGAGSGISPLMSILRYIKEKKLNINTHLIFSNKTKEEILWKEEIEQYPHTFTLTRENWNGKTGRINKEMIQENLKENTDFYLCGPPLFVKDIEKILIELKIDKKNIKKEIYN